MALHAPSAGMCLAATPLVSAAGCDTRHSAAPTPTGLAGLVLEPALLELTAEGRQDRRRDVTCRLINRSNREVRITSVETKCACTMAGPLERTVLAPGEAVPLRLTVSRPSHGRRETAVAVAVEPASVAAPTLRLVLQGPERPVPYLESVPEALRLAGHRAGGTASQVFEVGTIELAGSEPWLRGATDPAGTVEVRLEVPPTDEPRGDRVLRTYRFRVRGRLPERPDAPKRFSLRLTAATEVKQEDLPFEIHGRRVLEPLARAVPAQIVLRRSEIAAWPVTRRVMIVSQGEGDIAVNLPAALLEWLTLRPVDGGTDRVRTFEVEIAEPPAGGAGATATLRFGLRSEAAADLVVTVGA